MTRAAILHLDPKEAHLRQLRAAWMAEDECTMRLRLAAKEARAMERIVGADNGYLFPMSREKLALALERTTR